MQTTTQQPKKEKFTLASFEEAIHPVKKTSALGRGSYGIVKLVKEKGNAKSPLYAMKTVYQKTKLIWL